MKVVALVVIFLLIWRWACSSPLPCDDENCAQGKGKHDVHHCKHMDFNEHINDIVRTKRELNIKNFTDPVKNISSSFQKTLHGFNEREDPESQSEVHEQNTTSNEKIPGNSTEHFNSSTEFASKKIPEEFANDESAQNKDANISVENSNNSSPDLSNIFETSDYSREKRHAFMYMYVDKVKGDSSKQKNNTAQPQNTTRNKRQYPVDKNETSTTQNITRATRQNSFHNKFIRETQNSTQNVTQSVDIKNKTSGTQNTTKTKRQIFDIKITTLGAQNTTVKRHAFGTINYAQPFQTTVKLVRQTNNNTNHTHEGRNSTKLKRQSFDQNTTINAQNTTKVKRETYNTNNYSQTGQNKTRVKRHSLEVKNTTQEIQNKTAAIVKRHTTNITNNSEEVGAAIVRRQIFHLKNVTQNKHVKTKVKRQTVDHDTEVAGNTTKIRRRSSNVENTTQEADNKTTTNKQSFNIKNSIQEDQNITTVERESVDATNNTNTTEQTVTYFTNDSEKLQNTTNVKRETSDGQDNEGNVIIIIKKVIPKNHTTERNFTKPKRHIDSSNTNFHLDPIITQVSYYKTDDYELQTLVDRKPNKESETKNISDQIFELKCTSRLFVSLVRPNCTLQIFDLNSNISEESDGSEPNKRNIIKRQTSEEPKSGFFETVESANAEEKSTKGHASDNQKFEKERNNDVENITIQIGKYMENDERDRIERREDKDREDEEIAQESQVSLNSSRTKKNVGNPKNITIQIQKKRSSYTNEKHSTSNATYSNSSMVKKQKRSSFAPNQNLNTNSSQLKNQTISRARRQNVEGQGNTTINSYLNYTESGNKQNQSDSKPKREALRKAKYPKSSNNTKEHHRRKRDLYETHNNHTTDSNVTRVTREVVKTPKNTTVLKNQSAIAKKGKRDISVAFESDDAKSTRVKKSPCKETQKIQTTRNARTPSADQDISLNSTDKLNNTISKNQKVKRDMHKVNKNSTTHSNSPAINLKSINNTTTLKNSSVSQEPRKTRSVNEDHTYIMKIARRASANNGSKNNEMPSRNQKHHSRKRRSTLLDDRNDDEVTSSQENSQPYIPTHVVLSYANVNNGKYIETNNATGNSIESNEVSAEESSQENLLELNEQKKGENSTMLHTPMERLVFFVNGVRNGEKFKKVVEVNRDDNSVDINEIYSEDLHKAKGYYKYVISDNENKDEYGDDMPEYAELFRDGTAKTSKHMKRVKCACAMYHSDPIQKDKSPSFSESILEVSQGLDGVGKELLCTRSCRETAKINLKIKQEAYCTQVSASPKQLKKIISPDQEPLPEECEMIFCQVFMGEPEPSLQFVLSWLNIVLLDVVVCLTGLGIVCMYLICFVTWRRRSYGPAYSPAAYAATK